MTRVFMLLAAVLAYSSLARGAKYCCYPPIWESLNFFREGAIANGTVISVSGTEMISVDTNISMVNSMASLTTGGQTSSIRTIQDWANGKQYVINGDKCTKSTLPGPYPNKCVPDDAKVDTMGLDFGIGSNQLTFDVYSIMRGNVTAQLNIARPDCTPLAVNSYGSTAAGAGLSDKLYTNFTMGIHDRSVFNIPSICNQGQTVHHHEMHYRSIFGF